MSSNPYKRLLSLIPAAPRLYGIVLAADAAGTVIVQLPDESQLRILGTAEVGDAVFFRDGVIESITGEKTAIEQEI